MIFDTHAHYDDEVFDTDRDSVLKDVNKSGIQYIIDAGSSVDASRKSVKIAEAYDFVYSAVGVHPEEAGRFDEKTISILKAMAAHKKVVAIGEIGLDYYYEGCEKEVQKRVFEEQINLALELDLPIIVHDREAHADTYDLIRKYKDKGIRGVLHCYSGSRELASEYIKLGFYLGFTGVITFKNAKKAVDVLRETPIDRILIETDCPYLAPVPFRGKRNDSRYLEYVALKACEVLGVDYGYFTDITLNNGKRLFGIK